MIDVTVIRRGRRFLYLRYVDPVTGEVHERSSKCAKMKDARKAAAKLAAELAAGGSVDNRIPWAEFRDLFESQRLAGFSAGYKKAVRATLNAIEIYQKPDRLNRINAQWLTRFRARMVHLGRRPATVHKYMQHLKTALGWAVDQGFLSLVPAFPKEKRNAGKSRRHMKGRPITTEEFERLLEKSPSESISDLLNGLWLSGLRLGEALSLTWDQWADGIRVQFEDGHVFLAIDSDDQKNGEVVLYPVTEDFAEWLRKTPKNSRSGFVFNPTRIRGQISRRVDTVSEWLVAIGEEAKVKVDQRQKIDKDGKPVTVTVWASAHDLRRGFGARWAMVVPPMVLRDLMRHASVETTEKYYIGINAKQTAKMLQKLTQKSDTLGDTSVSEASQ